MSNDFITILLIIYITVQPLFVFFIKNQKVLKIIIIILLTLYLVVLFLSTTGHMSIGKNGISVRFTVKGGWFDKTPILDLLPHDFNDFYRNVILALPLGSCIIILKQDKFWKCMANAFFIGFGVSFAIEFIQYATPLYRFPQLSDLIFNTLSCVLGALYTFGIIKLKEKILKI